MILSIGPNGKKIFILLSSVSVPQFLRPLSYVHFCTDAYFQGPLLAAGTIVISLQLGVSIPAVVQLGGYQLLVVGSTGPFVCACSRKFGKRPVFLFSGMM